MNNTTTILLGGGCFWCTESVFCSLSGVVSVVSGYAGGTAETANYPAVCTGNTDHVEVVEVSYDETIISTHDILSVFFATHDPTTLNRQGNDIGTQYASVIYCYNEAQAKTAEQLITELSNDGMNIVTRVQPAVSFYPAEAYHQNYYANNPTQAYCAMVIPPKLAKLRASYAHLLRS